MLKTISGRIYLLGVVLIALLLPLADSVIDNRWVVTAFLVLYLLLLRVIADYAQARKERG